MPTEKPRDFKGTIARLVRYLGRHRLAVGTVTLFAAASSIFAIIGPKILGRATTELFDGVLGLIAGTGSIDFGAIGSILLLTLGLYLVSTLFSYVQGWIMSGVSMKVTYQLRKDISEKINRMPLKYFDGTSHGEVLSRITNDVDVINQTLSQSLMQIVTSITTIIGVLVMMFSINWLMTMVALVVIPLSGVFVGLIIKRSQKYFKQHQDYLGHINGHVEEMYSGHLVMKAFNGEKKSIAKFDGFNKPLYGAAWKSQFLSGMMMPIMMFVGNLGYVAVCILGGWLAVKRAITVGDIQAFIQYVRSFIHPIAQIGNISNMLQQTAAAAERVFEFLDESEEIRDTDTPVRLETLEGHVEFRDVHFGYSEDKIVIKDVGAVEASRAVRHLSPQGCVAIQKLLRDAGISLRHVSRFDQKPPQGKSRGHDAAGLPEAVDENGLGTPPRRRNSGKHPGCSRSGDGDVGIIRDGDLFFRFRDIVHD